MSDHEWLWRRHNPLGKPASSASLRRDSQYDEILTEIRALQAKPRSALTKAGAVIGGALAAFLGIVLVLPMAELGIPLLLVGLRLLALQFDSAARVYARARLWSLMLGAWWKTTSQAVRVLVIVGAVAVTVLVVFWLF